MGNCCINLQQGTRKGGIASTQDFKTVMMNSTSVIHDASQGTHIGDIHIGIITCANDVLLLSDTMESLQFQIELFTKLQNSEKIQFHPTKTCVSIMGITQSEIQHLKEVQPFAINSVPISITCEFTHLGVDYNLDHHLQQ